MVSICAENLARCDQLLALLAAKRLEMDINAGAGMMCWDSHKQSLCNACIKARIMKVNRITWFT